MKRLSSFVDMAKTKAEIKEESLPYTEQPHNLYPYGLCLCLGQDELDKLDLDTNVEAGDLIHLQAIGKVTSVSSRETDKGVERRVEIQLTQIAVEDESAEEPSDMRRKVKNPYKK